MKDKRVGIIAKLFSSDKLQRKFDTSATRSHPGNNNLNIRLFAIANIVYQGKIFFKMLYIAKVAVDVNF